VASDSYPKISMWPSIHTNKSFFWRIIYVAIYPHEQMSPYIFVPKNIYLQILFLENYLCGQIFILTNVTIHIRTQKYLFTNPFSGELCMWPDIHTNKCHHTYSYPKISIYKSFSRELSMWPSIHTNKS
jgi:hypothetical protein